MAIVEERKHGVVKAPHTLYPQSSAPRREGPRLAHSSRRRRHASDRDALTRPRRTTGRGKGHERARIFHTRNTLISSPIHHVITPSQYCTPSNQTGLPVCMHLCTYIHAARYKCGFKKKKAPHSDRLCAIKGIFLYFFAYHVGSR